MRSYAIMLAAALLAAAPLAKASSTNPDNESPAACRERLGSAVKCFANEAKVTLLFCRFAEMQFAASGNISPFARCTKDAKSEMRPLFRAARVQLRHSSGGERALKDAYAYWLGTIDALMPGAEELKGEYDLRMRLREDGLNDRLERLLIED